jgi:hypothetical protein
LSAFDGSRRSSPATTRQNIADSTRLPTRAWDYCRLPSFGSIWFVVTVIWWHVDIHVGELLPTLENRQTIVRLIREWKADIVIAHRPWDYHPDHRYTGVLVQDAAYMV